MGREAEELFNELVALLPERARHPMLYGATRKFGELVAAVLGTPLRDVGMWLARGAVVILGLWVGSATVGRYLGPGALSVLTDPRYEVALADAASTAAYAIARKLPRRVGALEELVPAGPEMRMLTEAVRNQVPEGCTSGVYWVCLDSGEYFAHNEEQLFPAASVIKMPILLAFLQDVDSGEIKLHEKMIMRKEDVAGGAGGLQYKPIGTTLDAFECATQMMAVSDNTATNMIVHRLGGTEALNRRFFEWGLRDTVMRDVLPDMAGTNTTSPRDMAYLLALLDRGYLLSVSGRDRALDIMKDCMNDQILPRGISPDRLSKVAHKTGDIGFVVIDAGIVFMPNGSHYIAVGMVRRPYDDQRASDYLRKITGLAHTRLSKSDRFV